MQHYAATCGFSSFGRARPCQGRGGGFEPRNPLQNGHGNPVSVFTSAPWPSGKAKVCNTSTPSSILGGASKKTKHPFRVLCFFIQADKGGLAWHQFAKRIAWNHGASRAWHQPLGCISRRLDSIRPYGPIPYRRQAADSIHGFAVIWTRKRIDSPPLLCYTKPRRAVEQWIFLWIFWSKLFLIYLPKALLPSLLLLCPTKLFHRVQKRFWWLYFL